MSTIKFKRTSGSTGPTGLTFGEPAYVQGLKSLYIGQTAGDPALRIGAEVSTDGTLTSNSDNKIPTEKAVRTYVSNNSSAGGVTGIVAGTGISVSGQTGNVTITNVGVQSISGTTNEIEVSGTTGAVTIGLPNDVTIGNNLIVTGNLTVNGNTTTVNSNIMTVDDPIFLIGTSGGVPISVSDTGKDRGVAFTYFDSTGKTGFFGYDASTGYFTFVPDATITNEVVSGTVGSIQVGNVFASGATFTGNIYAPNIVNSVNGQTGDVTISGTTGDEKYVLLSDGVGGFLNQNLVYIEPTQNQFFVRNVISGEGIDQEFKIAFGNVNTELKLSDDRLVGSYAGIDPLYYITDSAGFSHGYWEIMAEQVYIGSPFVNNTKIHINDATQIIAIDATNGVNFNAGATFTGNIYAPNIVNSVNGQTGDVTISAGAGGVTGIVAGTGISVSGPTGNVTITNTGVLSVNGSTGAITNVARINEGNTFTVRQVMNAGATMTALYVANGITLNGTRFELKSNSNPVIIGQNTSTTNLKLTATNTSALLPLDPYINFVGGDTDTSTDSIIYIDSGSITSNLGRVDINTNILGITANQTLRGTLNVTGLGTFNAGITSANLFVAGGSTFAGIASFRSGITAAGATFTGTIRANALSTPSTVSGSNLTIESINETEVVPGILYTGGELNATAKNKIAFTVGSGNNTVPYPVLSFTNSNVNSAADITFTTLGGDIEMSAAGGIVFNPVTFINMADGVLYVDDTNNRVGVNKTSPSYPLDVSGLANFASGISASGITSSGKITSDSGFAITSGAINTQTSTYTLDSADNGKVITMNSATGITLAVPTGLPVGFNTTVISLGTGLVGISAASGVTLNSFESKLRIAGQHAAASIISYSSNIFNVAGGLTG